MTKEKYQADLYQALTNREMFDMILTKKITCIRPTVSIREHRIITKRPRLNFSTVRHPKSRHIRHIRLKGHHNNNRMNARLRKSHARPEEGQYNRITRLPDLS